MLRDKRKKGMNRDQLVMGVDVYQENQPGSYQWYDLLTLFASFGCEKLNAYLQKQVDPE